MRRVVLSICLLTTVHAQTPEPAAPSFEVASVKPNTSTGAPQNFQCCAGGRVTITNLPVRQLIATAFASSAIQTQGQIVGGPAWLSDRYDIVAKMEGGLGQDATGRPVRLIAMLRALLEDRFHVVTHTEMRETSVYALVVDNKTGALGPRLTRSDCTAPDTGPAPADPGVHPCGRLWGTLTGNQNGHGITMPLLANSLSGYWVINRPVLDKTGLTGFYDFHIEFTPAFLQNTNPDGSPVPNPNVDSGPTIFTALQEQLGLKLQGEKTAVEYLVIDRAERPTSD